MHHLVHCCRHCEFIQPHPSPSHHIQHNMPVGSRRPRNPSPVCGRYVNAVTNISQRVSGFVLVFIEIPLLLRICPTSAKFDAFIRRFTTNYMRAAIYGVMSLIQWLSLIVARSGSSLIAAAVVLMIAGAFYALAGLKHQQFVGSKTLGGQGVAQMIV